MNIILCNNCGKNEVRLLPGQEEGACDKCLRDAIAELSSYSRNKDKTKSSDEIVEWLKHRIELLNRLETSSKASLENIRLERCVLNDLLAFIRS